ncbi:MAG TPA: cytochrome b/b6 domain-containing protein [Anaerolineales bacterium]|nr:cytochrome b/b6 domain-containing protein [Anaerolineales bacterium]
MSSPRKYLRFPLSYRAEHWVLVATFTTLAVTGLVQKYAASSISEAILRILGGIETTRVIHHAAAVILMLEVVYHLGALGFRIFVRRTYLSMLPSVSDVRAAIQALLFNLGFSKVRPQQGRFTFEEKAEYWAVVWGTLVMVITGFMMWNPIATTRFLPGEFVPAAKSAHGAEAVLAVLAIVVWHIYHVHVREFNKSMFSGNLTEDEMIEEHPLELADLKAGVAERPVEPSALSQRKRVFYAVFGLLAAAMLFGIYAFVTLEQTAITTIPPAEDVVIYAPLTPTPFPTALPSATPQPITAVTWDEGIGAVFQSKCGACHGGPSGLGGLDLSSYAGITAGEGNGPAIVPGDPEASMLVVKQSEGSHPGQLSGDELALVRQWIEAGAPEN